MWLSAEFLIGLLSAIQVLHFIYALDVETRSDPCISKILSCEWFRKPFHISKENEIRMFDRIYDLNKACKQNAAYIKCIVRAEKSCKRTILSPMAKKMIKNRLFPAEICRSASPWQQLYLKEASCLNAFSKEAFAHCGNKIGIDLNLNITSEIICKHIKAIIDCSTTELQEKCGYYAGNIWKKMLMFLCLTEHKYSELTPEEMDIAEAISDDTISDFKTSFIVETVTDWFDSDAEMQTMASEQDKLKFPALPKYSYVHENKTTFALYEDLETGHMKYMGCGEADFFWIILSPLRSKYCAFTDLKSEYSEALFKCTIRIDAPCSPELDEEDRSKMAEIFHHRHVVTVLTPPNNQRSEDMAIMNVHYLKLYPYSSMDIPEKKVNLWTTETNEANTEQFIVDRKGVLEWEDDRNDVYQQSNGSGKDAMNSASHLPADEYESWDYYPLEKEDIYFPELLSNNIIYIEDDKGDLISLHDHRSPIYSKSVYQPHSLFRPITGIMPSWTNPHHSEEIGKVSSPSSIFKERISEFEDGAFDFTVKSDQQEYCSAEVPCDQNPDFISGFKTRPEVYKLPKNAETSDTSEEANQNLQKISSFMKLNVEIDLKTLLIHRDVYDVTPSTEIEIPESSQAEQLKEEDYNYFIDVAHDSRYVNPDYSSPKTSVPYSVDFKIDSMKPFREYRIDAFSRPQYLSKQSDATINSRGSIDVGNLKAKSSPEIGSLCKGYLTKKIVKILRILFEKSVTPESLDKVLALLE